MKTIATLLAVASALCLALVATPAEACERRAGKGHGMMKMIMRTAQLTPDQKNQVKAMRQEFKANHKGKLKGERRAKRAQMAQLTAAAIESGDEGQLEELFAAQDAMQAKHRQMKRQRMVKVLSILTDEQRARVAKKIRQHRGKKRHRRGGDFD